ncbi:MAG: lectin [Burkholderiales bacterium]|nr:lectin [Burkholderiales bacterium]MBH2014943.1 lectin [Burkholderiales bacterium]
MNHRKQTFIALAWLGLSGAALAQATTATPPPANRETGPFSFFVTSVGSGKGADLGGLAGADAHCQKLAAAVGAGNKTWRAYLSTQSWDGKPAVHARDRIGTGPWFNVKGALIARSVSHLHGDDLEEARIGNAVNWSTALTEQGQPVKRAGDTPNEHDILTGSQPDGRAFVNDVSDRTCKNYTSSAEDGAVQVGHFDRTGGVHTALSWNSAHASRGCSQPKLVSTGGAGYFYCFAAK